ncbi:M50 protein [Murid betaherpesvirus 1]|nr:M50 protein [Murid betaherpesvirus 1]
MEIDKNVGADLISNTRRILRLDENELRITDTALICKNPNYSLCDAMLTTDIVYPVEYLLSYWECRSGRTACFVFKNTGCRVSLSCYIGFPERLKDLKRVCDFNFLSVNEALVVTLADIERIKPCDKGVLTNCVVRKSNSGMSYNIEVVAFGPDNEAEYQALLRDIYARRMTSVPTDCGSLICRRARCLAAAPPRRPPPPPPPGQRWGTLRKHGPVLTRRYAGGGGAAKNQPAAASPTSTSTSSPASPSRDQDQTQRPPPAGDTNVTVAETTYSERTISFLTRHANAIHCALILAAAIALVLLWLLYWHAARSAGHP